MTKAEKIFGWGVAVLWVATAIYSLILESTPRPIKWPKAIMLEYPSYQSGDIPQGCLPGTTSIKLITENGYEERCIIAVTVAETKRDQP